MKEEKVSLLYYDPVFFEVRTKTYLAVGPTCDKRRSLYKKFIQGAGYKIIDDDDLCLSFT